MPLPNKTAVLLVNLGSPDSTSVADVRRYLREFLSDERVLDGSWLVRQFVLNCFILPFRPRRSAEAYSKIWMTEGSPLLVISRRVQSLLQEKLDLPVELAMRYVNPPIRDVLRGLVKRGIREILLVPLYPHYAMSSYETVVERVREVCAGLDRNVALRVLRPFYAEPDYVRAMVEAASPHLAGGCDHLLFSFHGLPERHIRIMDRSGSHCLVKPDCCATPHPAHEFCYRAQSLATMRGFMRLAGIPDEKCSFAFQSRLGRDPWLKPSTDAEIPSLARRGIRKLAVICPSFVCDCLETLEEIGIRGREAFREAGGAEFTLIPCLNDHPLWIEALAGLVRRLDSPPTARD